MSLLLPSALALLGLASLPVIAHLTRQTPTHRVAFGAMLLVERLVKRLRRQRRVKDPWLLALRLLAALALVITAAAPRYSYQGDAPEVGGSGRVVFVIDQSMSMSQQDAGATLLQRARDEAIERIQAMPDGVLVGVVAYGQNARALSSELTVDHDRLVALVDDLQPTLERGDLRGGLLEARRLLKGEQGEVLLLSDEAGPSMVPMANDELARLIDAGSAVVPVPVHADPPRNVAITSAVYGDGIEGGQVVARVTNFGPTSLEVACEVVLPGGVKIPVFVDLPPEGQAEARVTVPREVSGGVGQVHCDDPDLAADDRRYFHLPRIGASRVLVVDGDPGDTPIRSEVYFIERALSPWGGLKSGVTVDVISPVGLVALDPEVHRVVFMANVSDPRPFGGRLRDFVRRGGSVVIAAGDNVTDERYNHALAGILPSPFRKPSSLADRGEEPVPLAPPDTSLELFEPFSRGGRSAFTRIGSWRVLMLEPYAEGGDVQTLLRYEGGVPALVERKVGKGRVLVWTSTVDFAWSNLPLQATFMPLVQRLVDYLGGVSSGQVQRHSSLVGMPTVVPLDDSMMEVEVARADGELVRSVVSDGSVVFTPDRPGGYQVRLAGGPAMAWVAVNLDDAESDVRRTHSVAAAEADLRPELFMKHVPLAPYSAALGLLALVLSALLGTTEVKE